jgi:tetratricopeptide (TPR) repeat protein
MFECLRIVYMNVMAGLTVIIWVALSTLAMAQIGETKEAFSQLQPYGHPFPIWSPLTAFEVDTVNDLTGTSSPSAETLLAFYILASGDDRQGSQFERYKARLDRLVADLQPRLRRAKPLEQGALLFQAMHEDFFPRVEGDGEGEERGYVFDQSQLTRVFEDSLYNCLSSSLLFIVLAKKIGFDVSGVVIPSHVFVELRLGDNKKIDIETTSRGGFNILHDAAFYRQDDIGWFTDRNLTPPTYDDYLNREVVSTTDMGLLGMWSQHTASTRMDYVNRMRLAELRAHIMPADRDAQRARLIFYHEEFSRYEKKNNFSGLSNMYDQIRPYIDSLAEDYFREPEMLKLLVSVKSEMALTDIKTNRESRGLDRTGHLLRSIQFFQFDVAVIEHNLFYIVEQYVDAAVNLGDFERARMALADLEPYCRQSEVCAKTVLRLYSRWGEIYWRDREWGRALEVYRTYLEISEHADLDLGIEKNMQSAFVNWAAEYLRDGEWESAIVCLETCINELGSATFCRSDLEKIRGKVAQGYY